ncbi:methyltransferase domain-containing protein [bacterium]|nr:methyltransferase domain-containing protein [bacterium]MBU1958310.1 methyltransferase domain-containing protein [bacterium]
MKIVKEFSRFAHEYNRHNVIQSEVAKRLVSMLAKDNYRKVLDLGSGSGAVYKNMTEHHIHFNEFIAFDFSEEMLSLHPSAGNIKKICLDFNQTDSFESYANNEFDLVISASALQWSENLSNVLSSISHLAPEYYFAFFTAKTFSTLHQTAGIESPIHTKESIENALKKYYDYEMDEAEYHLNFNSVHEMLRYIKRSGVSGGSGQLSYKQMKQLMSMYPLEYLEFEVLFVKAIPKGL